MREITASFFIFCFLVPSVLAQLRFGFYDSTCPSARSIVLQVVAKHWSLNQTVTAALLRMQFHDCFVNVRKLLLVCFYMYHVCMVYHKVANILNTCIYRVVMLPSWSTQQPKSHRRKSPDQMQVWEASRSLMRLREKSSLFARKQSHAQTL